ncbi:MAG: Cys-tRNA(Pro) deacylase [Candidatus Latescibacteria bacterium]|nr:Cys-tRNA(Pro) deacylase [Candidatus Latescibacterota bacterium]
MTPAVDAVRAAGVAFSLHEYTAQSEGDQYGLEAAQALDLPPEQVFKTLVTETAPRRLVLALVPAPSRLNLKNLARAAGDKRAALADPELAQRATGYVLGGISPLGQRRLLPTFIDDSLADWPQVYISAGRRGLQLALAPSDLLNLTQATLASLIE